MRVTDLISTAFRIATTSDSTRYSKWIDISHKLARDAGTTHIVMLQRVGSLDMLLRLLETERREMLKDQHQTQFDMSLDLQLAWSESWIFSAYEVLRSAKQRLIDKSASEASRLLTIEHRLALVRIPLAKGEIKDMDKKANKANPPMLQVENGDIPEPYKNDGSYILPRGICPSTGAVMWLPADMKTRKTVPICRRDLSDEILSLFD